MATWICSACTYCNAAALQQCEMCGGLTVGTPEGAEAGGAQLDSDLQAALEESARLHSSTISGTTITGCEFLSNRQSVAVLPQLPAFFRSSLIRQVGALNQFHPRWSPMIRTHEAPSATCGYISVVYAQMLAGIPLGEIPQDINALKTVLQSTQCVDPLMESTMAFLQRSRRAWIDSHAGEFTPQRARSYMSNWVANFVRTCHARVSSSFP